MTQPENKVIDATAACVTVEGSDMHPDKLLLSFSIGSNLEQRPKAAFVSI